VKPDIFDRIHAERQKAKNPTHEAGKVTGFDSASGLPIVKRKAEQSGVSSTQGGTNATGSTSKAAGAMETAATPEAGKPKADETSSKTQATQMTKGSPVRLPDGSSGRVAHVVDTRTVRVRTDDGKNVTARIAALTVLPHTQVQAHIRRIGSK
jgi:preprotein translocase subunit YajC